MPEAVVVLTFENNWRRGSSNPCKAFKSGQMS